MALPSSPCTNTAQIHLKIQKNCEVVVQKGLAQVTGRTQPTLHNTNTDKKRDRLRKPLDKCYAQKKQVAS